MQVIDMHEVSDKGSNSRSDRRTEVNFVEQNCVFSCLRKHEREHSSALDCPESERTEMRLTRGRRDRRDIILMLGDSVYLLMS